MAPVSLPYKRVTRCVVYLEEHLRSVTSPVVRVPRSSCKNRRFRFLLLRTYLEPGNQVLVLEPGGTRPGLRMADSGTGWESTPQV
ncbi:unnamed protein product [Sphagnum balticum]